ncbi:MAG: hypothetical protein MJ219_00120 [Mycoplasmoidaceae bacterium]|nr:hypothetical protein [Mycoplasmoidaceae bacterium]
MASSIAPAITSCSCFKSFKVSVTGKYSNLDGQQFKAKYHKTFDKTGT